MSSACVAPALGTDLEVWLMAEHDTGNRKLRHGRCLLYKLDICADDTETVSHIHHGYLNCVAGYSVKYKTCRIFLSADAQRMNLDLRLCCRKCRRYLQHVGSKLHLLTFCKVIGVILDEAGSTLS